MNAPGPVLVPVLDDYGRPAGAVLVAWGLAHVLAPGLVLRAARELASRGVPLPLDPQRLDRGRIRAMGLAMIASGGHLLYHGGLEPR